MEYFIARLIAILALMAGSSWLIARYRAVGVIISVFLGWGILHFVYNTWPAPPIEGDWDEDRVEIDATAPIVLSMWCLPVWGVLSLWSWFKKSSAKPRGGNVENSPAL